MKKRKRPRNLAARPLQRCRPQILRDRTKYTRKGRKPRGPHGAFHICPLKPDWARHAPHSL